MSQGTHAPSFDAGRLRDLIEADGCEWVFFDYFDTLARRTVAPEQVKRIACDRLAAIAKCGLGGAELYRRRAELERRLCLAREARGDDLEFELRDALRVLWQESPELSGMPQASFVELGMATELAVECSVQVPNEEVVAVLTSIAGLRRCAVVSDFYVGAADFRTMLAHHGIADAFDKVFVSVDFGLNKRSGRLFPEVLRACDVHAGAALIVGDNRHSDHDAPISAGLSAFHLDASRQHAHYSQLASTPALSRPELEKRINRALADEADAPFSAIAFALNRFTEHLYWRLARTGERDVYFLAREGQVLKRLFDGYQERRRLSGVAHVRSHYLEVSRKSTFLPSLGPLEHEDFERLFRQYRRISMREFLRSLGLEPAIDALAAETGIEMEARHEDLCTSDALRQLLASASFAAAYETARHASEAALRSYLEGFPRAGDSRNLVLVDVGWKGTIQDNLVQLVRRHGDRLGYDAVEGLYLGMVAPGAMAPDNRKEGLLFNSTGARTQYCDIYAENLPLFEVLLAADHGSCDSYAMGPDGRGHPVRSQFHEEALFTGKIARVQEAIEHRVTVLDATLLAAGDIPESIEHIAAERHAAMVFDARRADREWFSDVTHVENFGMFEVSRFDAAAPVSDPVMQLRFFRRLAFGLPLPHLGFWPWLGCRNLGGPAAGWLYRRRQSRDLRRVE